MADVIYANGSFDLLDGGGSANAIVRNDRVLTVTVSRRIDGFPTWHPRYTDPIPAELSKILDDDFFSGRAKVYSLDPVILMPEHGQFDLGNHGRLVEIYDDFLGTFDDFSISVLPNSTVDPLLGDHTLSTIIEGSQIISSAQGNITSAWNRVFRTFYPPKKARYIVPKVQLTSVANGKSHYLDSFQLEVLPVSATPVPTTFAHARQIKVRVNPTRLNLSWNPGFEVSAANLTNSAGTTIATDNNFAAFGSQSLKVSVPNTASAPVRINETNLIPVAEGEFLACSQYTWVPATLNRSYQLAIDFYTEGGALISTALSSDVIKYATSGVAARPSIIAAVPAGATQARFSHAYTPVQPSAGTDVFYVDGVLIEKSREVGDWFNGGLGADYLWQQGGTPFLCPSYYYQDRVNRSYIVTRVLSENVPLGITVATPEYASPVIPLQASGDGTFGDETYGDGPYGGA